MPGKGQTPKAGDAKNFFLDAPKGGSAYLGKYKADPNQVIRNLVNFISPVQFARLKQDVFSWREAIREMERPYYPFRVQAQRIYIDTIQNGHVFSAIEKRRDLTLLRKSAIVDKKTGRVVNEDATAAFNEMIFIDDFIEYSWDAILYGYTLVSLGDIIDQSVQGCKLVPRWNISPDRMVVTPFPYSPTGTRFDIPPYDDWHIWINTKSENGVSPCGYGLLYKIAIYEILLRQNLAFNSNFVELFAQPFRIGKTSKTDENERAELAQVLIDMGSNGWAVLDPEDEIEFKESGSAGTGWQSYDNFEDRLVGVINKVLLGHKDAMESIPGQLGSGQGEDNPILIALSNKQQKDGAMIERIVNNQLLPRLKKLGVFTLPAGTKWAYLNDGETEKAKKSERENAKEWADVAVSMKSAGVKIDIKQLAEKTGLDLDEAEESDEVIPGKEKQPIEEEDIANILDVKNRLNKLYQ